MRILAQGLTLKVFTLKKNNFYELDRRYYFTLGKK